MPRLIKPEQMPVAEKGEGWQISLLAGTAEIGSPAMVARRWSLMPGAKGPGRAHLNKEQLLYVIAGSGIAHIGQEQLKLERETMLWLETGDTYQFEAGPQGLEILQGYAPGNPDE